MANQFQTIKSLQIYNKSFWSVYGKRS